MALTGCKKAQAPEKDAQMKKAAKAVTSGTAETVRFAVSWSTDSDPNAAGTEAVKTAIAALACSPKGIIFYTYYQDPNFTPNETEQFTAVKANLTAEDTVAKAIFSVCGEEIPNIGCRAHSLTNAGTLLQNAVVVLAVGGDKASVGTMAVPILDDRLRTGKLIASEMQKVTDLKVIIALAEMRLSFETKDGVSVEDFIRGVLNGVGPDVTLFGGNSMIDGIVAGSLAGKQYLKGNPLQGHVVAMGIGGPLKTFYNHTNEFKPSQQTVTVTDVNDKWIVTLDNKPAMQVYRDLRGMSADEPLTSDWQHPIGVVVDPNKVYLRMVLDWTDPNGKDKNGQPSTLPPGSLKFVAPVAKGSQVRILAGGSDAKAIVASASDGISQTMAEVKAANVKPALCLVSNCCARGMRLRTFRQGNDDEVTEAIIPAMGEEFPLFGFYAWGELGRIKGEYQGMNHQYQQHTFVTAVIGIE
jgi:hypothetical protein